MTKIAKSLDQQVFELEARVSLMEDRAALAGALEMLAERVQHLEDTVSKLRTQARILHVHDLTEVDGGASADWYTMPELTSHFDVTRQTIYNWRDRFLFPHPKGRIAGQPVYAKVEVDEWEAKYGTPRKRATLRLITNLKALHQVEGVA